MKNLVTKIIFYCLLLQVDLGYVCRNVQTQFCDDDLQQVETVRSNYRHYEELLEDDLSCPYVAIDLPTTDDSYQDMLSHAQHYSLTYYVTTKGYLHMCMDDFSHMLGMLIKEKALLQKSFTIDAILTYITMTISTVSLMFFIVIYATDEASLKTIGGKNIFALAISLFTTQITYMVGIGLNDYDILCQIIGVALHAMWNNIFSWMVICAVGIWRILRSECTTYRPHAGDFLKNIVISIAFPTIIVMPMATIHFIGLNVDAVDIQYGGSVCFLSTFEGMVIGMYVPVGIMLLVTMSSFVHFTLFINRHRNQTSSFVQNRYYLVVFVKLCTIFGFGWCFGILANVFQSDALWYTFYMLTGLQGLFMSMAFLTKSKVVSFVNSFRSLQQS